jgi:L-gulonolactone oxidase
MIKEKSGVWQSWNDNIKYSYKTLYKITSEEELKEIVKKSEKIKFFGTKQSSADIASGVATLVDMTTYNKII